MPSRSKPRAPRKSAPTKPEDKKRIAAILKGLEALYPAADCELDYKTPLQLLVATILSAQCTDKRVNLVTPALFARYPDVRSLANADPTELEHLIKSTGFYRNKAKSVRGAAEQIVHLHGGEVPAVMEQLVKLPGVARKTANVVLGTAFKLNEGIAVDTHVMRLSHRLKLSNGKDPIDIEQDLMAKIPRDLWTKTGHQIILHGRRVCDAKKPKCPACSLSKHCPSAFKV